jgi:3-deoxy-D-manno-octulosonate 8-phosphate phosphatase (KDO 8-P phosphatase)
MKISENIKKRARKVKLIAMDVDGVLTGGEIIMLDRGGEIKIWNVKDRLGFHLVRICGAPIEIAWITGRKSRQVADRAKEMHIEHFYQDCMKKAPVMERILQKTKIRPEEVVYIGDDLIDIPVFRMVGLSVCPSDAPAEVKKEADYVSPIAGGKGIVREVIELVLKSRGLWDAATRDYR